MLEEDIETDSSPSSPMEAISLSVTEMDSENPLEKSGQFDIDSRSQQISATATSNSCSEATLDMEISDNSHEVENGEVKSTEDENSTLPEKTKDSVESQPINGRTINNDNNNNSSNSDKDTDSDGPVKEFSNLKLTQPYKDLLDAANLDSNGIFCGYFSLLNFLCVTYVTVDSESF